MTDESSEPLDDIKRMVSEFITERDWDKYHRPKDVAAALSIEASELQELYLWDRRPDREELEDELGDIFFFLIDMGIREEVDIIEALRKKIIKNEKKYPADLVKGSDKKYTRYNEKTEGDQ